jgi:hypothetical protein
MACAARKLTVDTFEKYRDAAFWAPMASGAGAQPSTRR